MNDITIMKRKEIIEYIPEKMDIEEFIKKIRMVTLHPSGDIKFHIFNDLCSRVTPVHSVWLKEDPDILLKNKKLISLLTDDANTLKNADIEAYEKWCKNIKIFLIENDLKNIKI